MAIYLPYSLIPILRNDLLYAIATMSEIWGMGIYDVIVLACCKLPPHIWELVIRLQRGERTLSLIFGSGAGDCALGAILSSTSNWVKGTCGGC